MKKLKKGFTLIELLVVVSLIGILATLVIANMNAARERARDATRKSDLRNIQTALRLYYNDYGRYPAATGALITACDPAPPLAPGACAYGSTWTRASVTYMSILPDDPITTVTTQDYVYSYINDDDYTLRSCLENKSDNKGVTDLTACPNGLKYEVKP